MAFIFNSDTIPMQTVLPMKNIEIEIPSSKKKIRTKKENLFGWTENTHRRRQNLLAYLSTSNNEEDPEWFLLKDIRLFYKHSLKESNQIAANVHIDLLTLQQQGFIKIIERRGEKQFVELQVLVTDKQIADYNTITHLHPLYAKLIKEKNLTSAEFIVFLRIKERPNTFCFSTTLRSLKQTQYELNTILKKLEALNLIQRKDLSQSFMEASKYQVLFKENEKK